MKEFVNPNLHVVLVHYPLAMLVVGTLIELFSFLWRRSSFRSAGRWMILIGALSAVPVVTSGIYALRDVAVMNTDYDGGIGTWHDIAAASKLSAAQWSALKTHLLLESFAAGLAVLVVVTWIGASDRWRLKLHWPLLILLLGSVGLAGAGAYDAGETVYVHGTGVLHHPDAALSINDPASTQASPTTSTSEALIAKMNFFAPPMQGHVIMAGVAIALAMASIGLSIRKITQGAPLTHVDEIAIALGGPDTVISAAGNDTITSTHAVPLHTDVVITGESHVPASKFWLLTSLAALLTAGGGVFILAMEMEKWSIGELWTDAIIGAMHDGNSRRMAHAIAGLTIVILPLVLAILGRWAPRGKVLLGIFSALLLIAVGLQLWFGIALLYDSPEGPLFSMPK